MTNLDVETRLEVAEQEQERLEKELLRTQRRAALLEVDLREALRDKERLAVELLEGQIAGAERVAADHVAAHRAVERLRGEWLAAREQLARERWAADRLEKEQLVERLKGEWLTARERLEPDRLEADRLERERREVAKRNAVEAARQLDRLERALERERREEATRAARLETARLEVLAAREALYLAGDGR